MNILQQLNIYILEFISRGEEKTIVLQKTKVDFFKIINLFFTSTFDRKFNFLFNFCKIFRLSLVKLLTKYI